MQKHSPAFGLALIFALGGAQGQDLKAAQACTRLSDEAARLSCYDAAMGRAKAAASDAAKPQPSAPPKAARSDAQAGFGDDGRLQTQPKPHVPKTLTAQVQAVVPLAPGLYRLRLDNGQVWDTTQEDSSLTFKANDAVTISRLILGGYQISLSGHTTSVSATRKQ
jgi:hypothetical protein